MRKSMLAWLLCFAISFSVLAISPAAAAPEAYTKAKVVNSVNLRTAPSTGSSIVRSLKNGEVVSIIQQTNANWYEVKDAQGKKGFVSTSSSYTTITSNALIVRGVNFRQAASTAGVKIRMLQSGEEVLVLERASANWYKIKDANGTTGYVSSSAEYIDTAFLDPNPFESDSVLIEKVIQAGLSYLGTPYEYGSSRSNNDTFDCSDFTRTAYREGAGIIIAADSRAQNSTIASSGSSTDWRSLKRGDLMFFMAYKGAKISSYSGINKQAETINHVGIYLGNGQMLHTYSVESGGVRIDSIAGTAWEYRFVRGGSVIQ